MRTLDLLNAISALSDETIVIIAASAGGGPTRDATSGIYAPATAAQWTSLGLTAPNGLWLLQEASGLSFADSIGTATMTGAGTITDSAVLAGWSRKMIYWSETDTAHIRATAASLPDPATTSCLILGYITASATAGATRTVISYGTTAPTDINLVATTPSFQLVATATTTSAKAERLVTQPILLLSDATNNRTVAYTLNDKIVDTRKTGMSGKGITIGWSSTYLAANQGTVYAAAWYAATAEMTDAQIKTMLNTLGWSPTWSPTVTIDATSNIYAPASAAEWTTMMSAAGLATGNPSNLWLMQEASGNLADSIGTATLTAANTPTYASAATGWTRKGIAFADGTTQKVSTTTGVPDLSTTSVMLLLYARVAATPAATRTPVVLGATIFEGAQVISTGQYGAFSNATFTTGTTAIGTGVRPLLVRYNHTAGTMTVFTDAEKISVVYTAGAGVGLYLGGQSSTPSMSMLYGTLFTGAAAELTDAQVRVLLQTLGWSITAW